MEVRTDPVAPVGRQNAQSHDVQPADLLRGCVRRLPLEPCADGARHLVSIQRCSPLQA